MAPAQKKPPATRKGQAAREEATKPTKRRKAEFRGITFELPPSLPGSMAFDIYGLGQSSSDESRLRFLNTVLGLDQLELVRAKMDADGVTLEDAEPFLAELVETIFDAYGMSPGESPASARS